MKLTIKDGVATPINPFTEKEARKVFIKKHPKFKAFETDGETPYPNTKEIDISEFKKVYSAGLQKSFLVHKAEDQKQFRSIVIKVSVSEEPGKIDIDTAINNNLTVKDALLSMQKSYQEYSLMLQKFFGVDDHLGLIAFLNEREDACGVLVREVLSQKG